MYVDLAKIPSSGLIIQKIIEIPPETYQNTSIKKLGKININGIIKYDYIGNIDIDLKVNGQMTLEDALTLENIEYPFSLEIQDNMEYDVLKSQDYYEKTQNALDIIELLWQNIVLEVPIRVISTKNQNVKMKGNGWQLNDNIQEEIDPRLAPLLELLDEGKE